MENITGSATTLQGLNPQQLKAATHKEGPLLILAGAGSGKTRVLTNRIAWLIAEQGADPWSICAITFTNKAAGEMRERVERMVGFGSEAVHVATFHSTCVRMLRRFIDRSGYERSFDIYDSDDSKSLMKDIFRHLQIDTRLYKERFFLSCISHMKDELIDPQQCAEDAALGKDTEEILIARVYAEYQRRLKQCNALDFDDLIMQTVRLLREHKDVLEYYQNRWKYLMVDEYQDTNKAQFVFVSLLAQKYRNLCVVGDDDQSIYRFRGADIGNILNFEKIFPESEVIRLEQNYRSTQNILDAANSVISNNTGRKEKHLWTDHGKGDPISIRRFEDGAAEARFIVDDLARKKRQGIFSYRDSAVLYRTNAQSRSLEEQLLYENIPYQIIGGTNFYSRREIKDVLAYLRLISNTSDDVALKRIINVPKRGIGDTSVNRVDAYAQAHGMTFFDVARMADKVPGIGRGGLKIREFVNLIRDFRKQAEDKGPADMIKVVLDRTGYREQLEAERTDEAMDRLQNIGELLNKAALYEKSFEDGSREADDPEAEAPDSDVGAPGSVVEVPDSAVEVSGSAFGAAGGSQSASGPDAFAGSPDQIPGNGTEQTGAVPTLHGFLEEVALVADIDSFDQDEDRVALMTLHSAKGLEFPNVYISGMDEDLFPSYHAVSSADSADMEEERRLCYVGITRAKERLTLTGARMRMLRGQMQWYAESRFIRELPREVLEEDMASISSRRSYSAPQRPSGAKRPSDSKPFYLVKDAAPASSDALGYGVGDTVRHVKFGQGVVKEIRDGGRDKEVTVEFEKFGTKKMFAGFAKLVKV